MSFLGRRRRGEHREHQQRDQEIHPPVQRGGGRSGSPTAVFFASNYFPYWWSAARIARELARDGWTPEKAAVVEGESGASKIALRAPPCQFRDFRDYLQKKGHEAVLEASCRGIVRDRSDEQVPDVVPSSLVELALNVTYLLFCHGRPLPVCRIPKLYHEHFDHPFPFAKFGFGFENKLHPNFATLFVRTLTGYLTFGEDGDGPSGRSDHHLTAELCVRPRKGLFLKDYSARNEFIQIRDLVGEVAATTEQPQAPPSAATAGTTSITMGEPQSKMNDYDSTNSLQLMQESSGEDREQMAYPTLGCQHPVLSVVQSVHSVLFSLYRQEKLQWQKETKKNTRPCLMFNGGRAKALGDRGSSSAATADEGGGTSSSPAAATAKRRRDAKIGGETCELGESEQEGGMIVEDPTLCGEMRLKMLDASFNSEATDSTLDTSCRALDTSTRHRAGGGFGDGQEQDDENEIQVSEITFTDQFEDAELVPALFPCRTSTSEGEQGLAPEDCDVLDDAFTWSCAAAAQIDDGSSHPGGGTSRGKQKKRRRIERTAAVDAGSSLAEDHKHLHTRSSALTTTAAPVCDVQFPVWRVCEEFERLYRVAPARVFTQFPETKGLVDFCQRFPKVFQLCTDGLELWLRAKKVAKIFLVEEQSRRTVSVSVVGKKLEQADLRLPAEMMRRVVMSGANMGLLPGCSYFDKNYVTAGGVLPDESTSPNAPRSSSSSVQPQTPQPSSTLAAIASCYPYAFHKPHRLNSVKFGGERLLLKPARGFALQAAEKFVGLAVNLMREDKESGNNVSTWPKIEPLIHALAGETLHNSNNPSDPVHFAALAEKPPPLAVSIPMNSNKGGPAQHPVVPSQSHSGAAAHQGREGAGGEQLLVNGGGAGQGHHQHQHQHPPSSLFGSEHRGMMIPPPPGVGAAGIGVVGGAVFGAVGGVRPPPLTSSANAMLASEEQKAEAEAGVLVVPTTSELRRTRDDRHINISHWMAAPFRDERGRRD
eukprot:g7507.t1